MGAVTKLWQGDVPLATAFWMWAVLGGLLFNAATTALFSHARRPELPGAGPCCPLRDLGPL